MRGDGGALGRGRRGCLMRVLWVQALRELLAGEEGSGLMARRRELVSVNGTGNAKIGRWWQVWVVEAPVTAAAVGSQRCAKTSVYWLWW